MFLSVILLPLPVFTHLSILLKRPNIRFQTISTWPRAVIRRMLQFRSSIACTVAAAYSYTALRTCSGIFIGCLKNLFLFLSHPVVGLLLGALGDFGTRDVRLLSEIVSGTVPFAPRRPVVPFPRKILPSYTMDVCSRRMDSESVHVFWWRSGCFVYLLSIITRSMLPNYCSSVSSRESIGEKWWCCEVGEEKEWEKKWEHVARGQVLWWLCDLCFSLSPDDIQIVSDDWKHASRLDIIRYSSTDWCAV